MIESNLKSMKKIEEILFAADFKDKYKMFIEGLESVNSKYKRYFDSRKSKLSTDEKDNLNLHYWIINQHGNLTFGFLPDSDIDENIKSECVYLFNRIFNDKNNTSL